MGTDDAKGDGGSVYRPPGRPGLSFSRVQMAADELLREGIRPTVEKIRAKVGGSPNTIIEHLDKWWASLAKRMEIGSEAFLRLPRSYAHLAESFFHQSMDEFRKIARDEVRSLTDEVKVEVEETRQRTLLLDDREKELSQAIADRDQRITMLETALAERTAQLGTLRVEQQSALRAVGRLKTSLHRMQELLFLQKVPYPRRSRKRTARPLPNSQITTRKSISRRKPKRGRRG